MRAPQAALLVIDFQHGFLTPSLHARLKHIRTAMESYPAVAMSRFVNIPGSLYRSRLGWHDMGPEDPGQELAAPPVPGTFVFEKTGYSCVVPDLVRFLDDRGYGEVHLAGLDTEACVMATALSLFDAGYRVRVLSDLCASSAGEDAHQAALSMMVATIGDVGPFLHS